MEIRFNPDLQDRLARRAAQQGLDPSQVVQDVVLRFFEQEDRFTAAIEIGAAELDRGDFLTHEEVGTRLGRFLRPQ